MSVDRPSRRAFLTGALGAVAGAAALPAVAGCSASDPGPQGGGHAVGVEVDPELAARAEGAPNYVVIISDDHRADHLGLTGAAPFLSTPTLDALAGEGLRFTEAFCTTALCSPSRATFLTGQYANRTGVRNNVTSWTPGFPSVFEPLAAAGYRNAFIGKWHMPGRLPDLPGVERFVTFTVQEGQGQYLDCPLVIDGVPTERPGTYVTTDLTDLALEFLDDQDGTRPFCLVLAHKAVHHQFIPPADLLGTYDDVALDNLPPEFFETQTLLDRNVWEGAAGRLTTAYRRYCETLLGMDREIGRLLDGLEQRGLADSTLVVYTTDNGYSWGDHVLTGKRWPFEENIRLPWLVRWPQGIGDPGATRGQMVLNVDLAPTLLDLAGQPVPAAMQGRSLAPLLADAAADWRDDFLYEYFQDFPYNVPTHQAVRTPRWLYAEYERGPAPELFDLAADPRQQSNLWGTAAADAVVPALSVRLAELRREYA